MGTAAMPASPEAPQAVVCRVWDLTSAKLTIKCTNPSRCVCLCSLHLVGEGYGLAGLRKFDLTARYGHCRGASVPISTTGDGIPGVESCECEAGDYLH